jgi:hypothetical protein
LKKPYKTVTIFYRNVLEKDGCGQAPSAVTVTPWGMVA